jgi:hypothetical protein
MRQRIRISKEAVEVIFASAAGQADYLIGIYKLVLPDWDSIEKVGGWPSCNDKTWKEIARLAMAWDQKGTDCLAGGAWMNSGFSTAHGAGLPDWTVSLEGVELTYKVTAVPIGKE